MNSSSDICIEGFPRSANSFAVSAFRSAQPDAVSIAHHTHVAANLMRACSLDVPAALLIRAPRPAVISLQALTLETGVRSGQEQPSTPIPLIDHLRAWLAFYRAMRPYADQCVIAPFPQVVEDFGAVIQHVNRRFQRQFGVFEHTDANVERIRKNKGYHALPNERREQIKEHVRRDFEGLVSAPRARRLLTEAEELYDWYERQAFVPA